MFILDIYLGKLRFLIQIPMYCYMHLVVRRTVLLLEFVKNCMDKFSFELLTNKGIDQPVK